MAFSAILIGMAKTGLPGFGILVIPIFAAIFPAKQSTGLVLPMLIIADLFAVTYYKRHAIWSHLMRMLPLAAVGVVIGAWALDHVNDGQLRPIIGTIVLVMLAANYWRQRKLKEDTAIPKSLWFTVGMGISAGITTMMANAAGPIMTIYLVAMRLPKEAFIGTGAWYFCIINCFKVPFSAAQGLITRDSLMANLAMTPFIIIGALAGIRLVNRIPDHLFTAIVQVLAAIGALSLFLR